MPSVDLKSTMFCWCDLMTPDVESAKKFYGSLFGWSHEDMPGGEYGFYTMFSKGDVHVAGMGGSTSRSRRHASGVELLHPRRRRGRHNQQSSRARRHGNNAGDGGDGRGPHEYHPGPDRRGGIALAGQGTRWGQHLQRTWRPGVERVADSRRGERKDLLCRSVGLDLYEEMDMGEMGTYCIIKVGERSNGSIFPMGDDFPAEVPPHWMVYLGANDVDASAKQVTDLGGQIRVPPTDISVGRFAVVSDPQGGTFTLFKGGDQPTWNKRPRARTTDQGCRSFRPLLYSG